MTVDMVTNNSRCLLSTHTVKHFAHWKSFVPQNNPEILGTVPINDEHPKC